MSITLEWTGLTDVAQRLGHLEQTAQQFFIRAMAEDGQHISDASDPLTPEDTGLLKSTRSVETVGNVVELRSGGHGTAPYAAIVHEDTTMNHPRGGQSHYLQEPFFAATAGMAERLAARMRQMLGG